MERTKWYRITILAVICFFLTGCSKSLPDTYHEGSDYQYMERYEFLAFHQKGAGVQYFAKEHYLYYLDEGSDTLLPLCGKADCLHDKETDLEKMQECNAYMETKAVNTGIIYCNGYLYYVDSRILSGPVLCRVSADGMKREEVYKWEDTVNIEEWIVHRDVIYYTEHTYLSDKDGTEEQFAIKFFSLTDNVKKPENVYIADKDMDVFTLADLQAYGNFLYFQIHAQIKSEEETTDDNFLDKLYLKMFIYDMKEGKIRELALSDMPKNYRIQRIAFWQDKLLFSPYDFKKEDKDLRTWYTADLDGSHIEVFMEGIEQGLYFCSDGKYLYLSNVNMVLSGKVEGTGTYKIYDKDLTLVDTVTLPFDSSFGESAVGNAEYMYIIYEKAESEKETGGEKETEEESETEWGVSYLDKSKIGSYHGSAFEMTDIKYEG